MERKTKPFVWCVPYERAEVEVRVLLLLSQNP
jgi:hypothetical protein